MKGLCGVLTAALAFSGCALHANVIGLEGPAQARWGSKITIVALIENSGGVATRRQKLNVALRDRREPKSAWRAFSKIKVRTVCQGAKVAVGYSLTLPSAPDPSGNLDGDYDIALFAAGSNSSAKPVCPPHPIHLETRDARGRIHGVYVPRNYDLVAAQASPARTGPEWLIQTGIRHSRHEVVWSSFEPEEGKWNEQAFGPESPLGSLILQERIYDKTILPLFLGTAPWAYPTGPDGKKLKGNQPAADPTKWAAFVDRVVAYYCKAPYLQQDWQIWNEASGTVDTGFWSGGSWENYINKVHNPAAEAIHKHYVDLNGNGRQDPGERCRVVYGGFPCSNRKDASYAKVLEINGAGQLADILDAHYMQGLRWFQDEKMSGNVYDKWVATGRVQGCWQTEDGWEFSADPTWTPRFYFGDFHWALAHNWSHKDKYKDFFFHYYAAQPNLGFYWSGDAPKWPNGYAIRTLMRITRGDLAPVGHGRSLHMWNNDKPVDHPAELCKPILAGGRLVLHFSKPADTASGNAKFEIALKARDHVKAVTRTTVVKGVECAVRFATTRHTLRFELPWQAVEKSEAGMEDPKSPWAYITVECIRPIKTWN